MSFGAASKSAPTDGASPKPPRPASGQVASQSDPTETSYASPMERRFRPAVGRATACLPIAFDPDNRRAGADLEFLGCLAARSTAFDLRNHSLPHLPRIGLWHRPASQKRINADSLSHPRPHENPPDSIGAEHALVTPRDVSSSWVSMSFRKLVMWAEGITVHPFTSARQLSSCRRIFHPAHDLFSRQCSFRCSRSLAITLKSEASSVRASFT